MSLAKAAEVLENSLTTSALEQAHSCSSARDLPPHVNGSGLAGSAYGRMYSGRFSEEVLMVPASPAVAAQAPPAATRQKVTVVAPTPAPPMAAVLEAQAAAQPATAGPASTSTRSSFEKEQSAATLGYPGLRPSGASTCSLASASSVSSIPHSVASVGSQHPSEQGHAAALAAAGGAAVHPPSLARLSPRSGVGMAPEALAAARPAALPPQRPVSPLGAPPASVLADMPSPSQRVLRTSSVDAFSLLSRSSSMPPGEGDEL